MSVAMHTRRPAPAWRGADFRCQKRRPARTLRPHGLQALDVLIDRARANGATARQRHPRPPQPRQQRPEHQHRGAHGLDQFVGGQRLQRRARLQRHAAALAVGLHLHPHVLQQAAHGGHVAQARHVAQRHRLVGEQGGAEFGQGGVFGTGNRHLAMQAVAAVYAQFVHGWAWG